MGWLCDGHFNEGAHSYIMGCLEPGSWNAVVLAWSGCVDDAATRWRRHSYIMGWLPTSWEDLFLFHEIEQTGPIVRVTLGATPEVERKRNDDGGTLAIQVLSWSSIVIG